MDDRRDLLIPVVERRHPDCKVTRVGDEFQAVGRDEKLTTVHVEVAKAWAAEDAEDALENASHPKKAVPAKPVVEPAKPH